MNVLLHEAAFCPYDALRYFVEKHNAKKTQCGALASFCGIAKRKRTIEQGKNIELQSLLLDCYPEMAKLCMQEIIKEAQQRWQIEAATIQHRIGEIPFGETIVLVAVLSEGRNNSFEACRYIIDMVKVRPPLWKCECDTKGEKRWLTTTEQDLQKAEKWCETQDINRKKNAQQKAQQPR